MAQVFAVHPALVQDGALRRQNEWGVASHPVCSVLSRGGGGGGSSPDTWSAVVRSVGPVVSCQYPQLPQSTVVVCWLEIRIFSRKKSPQLSAHCQMPLTNLVLRRKEKKVVPFCFAEEMNLQVSVKPAVRNV